MKLRKGNHRAQASAPRNMRQVMLCAFFAAGIAAGHVAQRMLAGDSGQELSSYLRGYAAVLANETMTPGTVLRVLAVYLRDPLLLVVLGFCSFGAAAIPLVCLLQGFTLSFAVGCFSSGLGENGLLLSLAAFGLRGIVALPCTLMIAQWAFDNALRQRKGGATSAHSSYRKLAACFMVLLFCALLELAVVPELLLKLIE